MARLFWYAALAALLAAVGAGISWAVAYHTVDGLLGAPPPDMGTTTTTFLWNGMTTVSGHPRAWRFAFGPTRIPGAPTVRIYVSPVGKLLRTEPRDLAARVKLMHGRGFN